MRIQNHSLVSLLQRWQGWRLWIFVSIGTVVGAIVIVSLMSLLLKGEVTWDYVLTGFVTACIVAPPSLGLLSYLLGELTRIESSAALQESRNLLQSIIDTAPIRVFWKDRECRYLGCNPAFAQDAGQHAPADLLGRDDFAMAWAEQAEFYRADDRQVMESGQARMNYEEPQSTPDGRTIWLRTSKVPLQDASGQVIGVLGIYDDITERKNVELALQQRDQYQRALLDNFPFAVWLKDTESRFLAVNSQFMTLFGVHNANDLVGKNDFDIAPTELAEGYQADDRAVIATGQKKSVEEEIIDGNNVRKWFETYKSPVELNGKLLGTVGFTRDITERKAHQKQLEYIAHYDNLTGLPNRVLLADRLQQAMVQAQRHKKILALAYLDLDGFKAINDQYGHQIGDHLLTALSEHMKHALREGDTLARLGGDEFVAILLDLPDIESTAPMLSRLLAAAGEVIYKDGNALRVSASLGVTFYPQAEAIDAGQLLRQADQAMYQAKLTGKNRYHIFDTEQDRSVRGHHESLERIKQALNEREFVLYYQPKVNMRTGEVIGAEALIRWRHPERGLLPPSVFLPLITDHPLAIDMGEWVLDTAMTQIVDWKAVGLSLPVSVNIEAIQLEQADFIDRLRQQVAAHPELTAGDLELEVLETSALDDIAKVSSVILACREMGVGFALDDFGTGYSSLIYLKRLPVGMLKIDQSFVRDMLDDPEDLAILSGVLGLASAFRSQAIAEGVETLAHGEMLLQLGCELAQGYAIAHPMPPENIPVWLATWRSDPSWLEQTPISRDDLPILLASVEHRAWIKKVVSFIRGEGETPPIHHEQCRVGQWLKAEVRLRKENRLAIEALEPLHIEIHELANQSIRLKQDDQMDGAMALVPELYRLRDLLLAQFADMLQ